MTNRLEILLAGAVVLSAAGCGETSKPALDQNLSSYYPEASTLTLNANGDFKTGSKDINWYNFSNLKFDESAAKDTILFYQDIVSNVVEGDLPGPNDNTIPFEIQPRTEDVVIIIAPESAPDPSWGTSATGSMTLIKIEEPSVTFIKTLPGQVGNPYFSQSNNNSSLSFSIEACQASSQGVSTTLDLAFQAQEEFCNAMGFALSLKGMDISYEDYLNYIDLTTFQFGSLILSQEQWNSLPDLPPVLS